MYTKGSNCVEKMDRNLQIAISRDKSSFVLYEKVLLIKLKNRRMFMELGYFDVPIQK